MIKDYLNDSRQESAIYDAVVTPNVAIGSYTKKMATPGVQSGTYKAQSYNVVDWAKDAFTDWSVKRNQVNSDTSKGKAVILNEDLDVLSMARSFALAIAEGTDQETLDNPEYEKAYQKVLSRDLSFITKDNIDFNLWKRTPEVQADQISRYISEVLNTQQSAIEDAEKYDENVKYWEDKHKISDHYNAKSLKEGFNLTDIDTYIFKAPGLLGSSASSMLSQAAAMAAGVISASAGVAAGAAIAAGTGGAATPAAVATASAGVSVAASVFSRSEESYAEVYQHYKDKIRQQAEKDGTLKDVLEQVRVSLENGDNLTDDQVLDAVLSNKAHYSNEKFSRSTIDAVQGLESLYSDNMALSGVDIAQTAIAVLPYGQLAKKVSGLKKLGEKLSGIKKVTDRVTGIPEQISSRISDVAAFGIQNATKALKRKTVAKGIAEIGGKIMLTSAMEGMEEGTQYIKGKEYINNEFETNPNLLNSFVKNIGTQARSLYAAVTPFDDLYSTDAEFMENFKGGALLGGLMTGAMIGIQEGVSKVQTGNTSIGKQLNADEFVGALFTERVANKDEFVKNMEYAKAIRTTSKSNIDAAFDQLSEMKIDGVSSFDVQDEKRRANRVMAQAESITNKSIAQANGIDPRTEDYDILVALQEHTRNRYKSATTELNESQNKVSDVLNEIDWSVIDLPEGTDKLMYQTAAVNKIQLSTLEQLVNDYVTQGEQLSKITENLNIPTTSKDVSRVSAILRDMLAERQSVAQITSSDVDVKAIGIPQIDAKLQTAIEQEIYSEIDTRILREDLKTINGAYTRGNSKTTIAKQAVERYKGTAIHEQEEIQTLQDDVRGVVKPEPQVEITPVTTTSVPVQQPPVVQKPVVVDPVIDPVQKPTTPPVIANVQIGAEPEDIVQTRSRALEDVQAQSTHPAVKMAEEALKQVYETSIRPIPGIRPIKGGYAEYKAANEVDQYSIDENADIAYWESMYENKAKLQEAIIDNDVDAAHKYSEAIYTAIAERKQKAENEALQAQREAEQRKIESDRAAAELAKPIVTVEQVSPVIEQAAKVEEETAPVEVAQVAETAPVVEEAPVAEQPVDKLNYSRSVDPFSHQLNYWVNRKTSEPFQGYESGFESSQEFAKVSTEPNFLQNSDVQFVVKSYTDKKGVTAPAIYAEFTYNGKKYVAAISDPVSLRNYVSRGRSFDQTNQVIDNLVALRTKIMYLHNNLKPGTRIVPTLLERTDGVIVNMKNEDGSPKNINLTETGLVPTDPFLITPETVQIGISTGSRGNEFIRCNNSIMNGKGTRLGQAYLFHNNKPIQLNPRKFKQDPEVAEFIVDLLTADPTKSVINKSGTDTFLGAAALLRMLVNYGPQTAVREDDPRLTKSAIEQLKKKQFFTDGNKIFVGDKIYTTNDLLTNPKAKAEIIEYIKENFHWNVDETGMNEWYFGRDNNPFDYIKLWFKWNPKEDKLAIIPGKLEFNREDVGSKEHPKGLSVLGWYIRQGILQTDFGGYQDANIYVADVTVEDTKQTAAIATTQQAQIDLSNVPTEEIETMADKLFADLGKSNNSVLGSLDAFAALQSIPLENANASINVQNARQWLNHTLGLTDEVQIVDDVIDVLSSGLVVVGRAKLDSIELSKLAPEGTQYHEAWHRVSNLLISDKKRRSLYDKYNKDNHSKLTDTQIDEILADDFMQFQLYTEPYINYQVTNWFKKIANFIKVWSKVSNFTLAKMYYDINVGKYANAKSTSSNIERFKKLYKHGPNFTMKGVELKTITNTKEYNNVLDTLTFLFFSSNNIINYNDIDKLKQNKQDGMARLKLVIQSWKNKLPDNDTVAEIYNNFDTVFASALSSRLTLYNTTTFEKADKQNIEDIDAGEVDQINVGEHTQASYEVSKRDNAPAEVKFFFQTIPAYKYGADGKRTVETDPKTGFPMFTDPRKAWNTVLIDLHDSSNMNDIILKVNKLAENNLFYAAVATKIKTLYDKQSSTDESIASAAETTLTKLENTIRSHRHLFVTGKINRNDDGLIEVNIKDNLVDTKAIAYPKLWSSSLFYNINKAGIFQQNEDGTVHITENGKQVFDSFITNFSILKRAFTQGRGVLKLKSGEFDIHDDAVQNKVKQLLIDMLNSVGISIDMATIDHMLSTGEYGDYHKLTPYQLLNNLVLNTNPYGGLQSISSILQGVLNQVKLSRSNNVSTIDNMNKDHTITKTKPIDIWNNRGWVKLLAQHYSQSHVDQDELRSLGADGNNLYSIAQNNFASDQIHRLNTDMDYVSKLNSVVFNRSSRILNHINSGGKQLHLETFVNFKDDTAFDTGRDYFQITDREDYIAKMAMIFTNRIIFPTVADKKTYHVIRGVELPHERVSFTTVNDQQIATYGRKTIGQLLDYFNDEVAAIELCMQQIDDTVDKDGHHNPNWVSPERRVKNYHTGNKKQGPNGVHFRLITGIYYMQDGKQKFLNFNDPNKTPAENLQTAKNWLGNEAIPDAVKASLLSSTLSKTVAKEVQKAKDLGLISANPSNDIYSMKNILLDQRELNTRKAEYAKINDPIISANAEGYAIYDMLADYTINSIISIVEVEKVFSGDPAYYKYNWGEDGIIDMSVDKIKRLGALTSTGLNNRLDFGSRFVRPDYTTAELNDYEVASKQFTQLEQSFVDGSIYDFVRVYYGDSAIYNQDGTYKSIDELKTTPEYNDAIDAAILQARKEVSGYKSGINVADAAVYVSPNMYRDMMRMIGQWSTEVEEAFKILTDPASSRLWESDPVLYKKVLKTSLKPLKYMAFGQRLSEIAGLGIPYFNKMALFPLFESIATGDMKPLYDRMTGDNPLDMVMFNSAVKAGSVGAMDYYSKAVKLGQGQDVLSVEQMNQLDEANVSYEGNKISDLNNLVVYKQDFENLRQQLNTDPHTHEEQMAGTQMLKVGLSNIHMQDLYGNTDKITGEQLKTEVFNTMNALSDIGASKINAELLTGNSVADRKTLYKQLQEEAIGSDVNDNIISGLAIDKGGNPIIPLAACSDNNFIESSFIARINRKTVDINLPGGSFIQRSTFGLEASSQSVISDSMLNNGKRLNMLNEDGSMDSIVSINLFKHIIPGYKNMTFVEAKQWLIDHDVIGDKSTATAIGYRIPTQAIASISALRFTDVLPEIMGDTIILPEEFTKLTGSDFDVDKLFVARYQFKDGIKVAMDDTIENYAEQNEDSLKNNLIDMYMKVLLTKEHGNELKISIDNATENVKAVLKDIESGRKSKLVDPFEVYSPSYQEERKQEYTGGKAGIGPMALNNAHHILTQLINVKFAENELTKKLDLIDTNKIYDDPTYATSKGGRILDWLSAMINGFVDIAKDPYIVRLNVNPWTYNMVTYLLRMGKGAQTFYFIGQPILKEMAAEVEKNKGKFGVDQTKTASQLEKLAIQKVLHKYDPSGAIMKKFNKMAPSDLAMELSDLFTTYPDTDGKETSTTRELIIKGRDDFHDYNAQQVRIYFAFKTLSTYASDLADLVKYSKVDTKKMGKSFVEQRGFLNGMTNLAKDSNFKMGEVQNFYDKTFLTTKTRNSIELGAKIFEGELYRTSAGFVTYQDAILEQLNRKSSAGNKILNALTKAMEADIKSEFFNTKLIERGITANEMLYGKRSMAKRLLAFKQLIYQGKYPDLLSSDGNISNDFLEYLVSNINTSEDLTTPDFIDTAALFTEDVVQADNLINYWRDLLEHDKPEIKRLAEDLVLYAFVTSGDNSNANSFFNYVPNSWRISSGYVNFTNSKMEQVQSTGGLSDMSVTDFYLNNWHDDQLVKPYREMVSVESEIMQFDERGRPIDMQTGFITFDKPSTIHGRSIPVVILGKRSDRSANAEDVKPIGYKQVFKDSKLVDVPIFPPYIKIKLGKQNLPQNNVMYKLVGYTEEEWYGRATQYPVYSIVEKKGMKYKGHVITEYGRSDRFPFNKLDFQYDAETAIEQRMLLADIFSESSISDNYKEVLMNELAYVNPISQLYVSNTVGNNISSEERMNQIEQDLPTAPVQSTETVEDGGLDFGDVVEKPTYVNHSGGALGADTMWGTIGERYGVVSNHYYLGDKTPAGNTKMTQEDAKEGAIKVAQAAKANYGYQYGAMKNGLLIRDWAQVKYADAVFAVGTMVKPGERIFPNIPNDTRKAEQTAVIGGTGYAVEMAIQAGKPVYVFDQSRNRWFKHTEGKWSTMDETPTLTQNFAGIGSRNLTAAGEQAIRDVYEKTFNDTKVEETSEFNNENEFSSDIKNKCKGK